MEQPNLRARPLVSVVLATFNEVRHVERCVVSLLGQENPGFDLEILAIDGNSRDGTREILEKIASSDRRVRVFVNEGRTAPFAFNIGLREARGEYVCIFGSHTIYERDYISVCLRELIANDAVGCGGRVVTRPPNRTLQARLIAWASSHPFGSSRKSFRTQPEGFADAINYPVFVKSALLEAGGYDEELTRNQDNDMNQKLRARGHKLYCTWKTRCFYHTKARMRDFLKHAFRCGFWNVISFNKNALSLGFHHLVPFLYLLGLMFSSFLALGSLLAPDSYRAILLLPLALAFGLHLFVGSIAALQVTFRERSLGALALPFIFLTYHLTYGIGTLGAILTNAKPGSRKIAGKEAALTPSIPQSNIAAALPESRNSSQTEAVTTRTRSAW